MSQKHRAPKTGHSSKARQRNNQNRSARRAADILRTYRPDALTCLLPYDTQNPPTQQKELVARFAAYRRSCLGEFAKIGLRPFMFWTSCHNDKGAFCHVLVIACNEPSCALFLKSKWEYGNAQIFVLKDFPIDIVAEIENHTPNAKTSWNATRENTNFKYENFITAIKENPSQEEANIEKLFNVIYNRRLEQNKKNLAQLQAAYTASKTGSALPELLRGSTAHRPRT